MTCKKANKRDALRNLPSWAAETACFRAFSVSVVGFWENACAALLALAALVATPPTIPGKAELCTALELGIDELGVTGLADVMVGGIDADEDTVYNVVAGRITLDEAAEDAELDTMGVRLLDGRIGALGVDDDATTLDEGVLEDENMLLDVICIINGVLEATLLLEVAVAVQNSCGTTL